MAAATARLSVTTGLPVICSSSPYRARICGQSVSSACARPVVDGGDRGLELVLADRALAHRAVEQRDPFGDERPIPQRSILLGQRDQLARGVGPRGASGVDEQHEREQAGDLAVVGKQPVHHPGQPDRLVRQLGAMQLAAAAARRTPR